MAEENNKSKLEKTVLAGVKQVIEGEEYKNWLDTCSHLAGSRYSFRNAMLIYMQKPDASIVMGFNQWKDYGRAVRKGSKGISIVAPLMAYDKAPDSFYNYTVKRLKNSHEMRFGDGKCFIQEGGKVIFKDKEHEKVFENTEELKDFICSNIVGKAPVSYVKRTVFDISDVEKPEFLWMKTGFKKDELALDDGGNPIRNRKGEYKIRNSEERQNKLVVALNDETEGQNAEIAESVYQAVKNICVKNGVPVFERKKEEDPILSEANGYYSREKTDGLPKGFIVIEDGMDSARKCSVMIHEAAHSDLHGDLEKATEAIEGSSRESREIQAESVAYAVAHRFGIETDTHSFSYLAGWCQGNLENIQKSMTAIYGEVEKLSKEIDEELDRAGISKDILESIEKPSEEERDKPMKENEGKGEGNGLPEHLSAAKVEKER